MKQQDCRCCDGTGKEIDSVAVGVEMRAFREGCGVTLKRVARKIRLSVPYLSELERGNRRWSEELIERFKKACQ